MAENDEAEGGLRSDEVRRVWLISIVASLIASALFFAIFQPAMSAAGSFAVSIVSSLAQGVVNNGYRQAAATSDSAMVYIVLGFTLSSVFGAGLAGLLITWVNPLLLKSSDRSARRLGKRSKLQGYLLKGLVTFWALCAITSSSQVATVHFVAMQAKATYEMRMAALGPFLSDMERRHYHREWVFIRDQRHYDRLMGRLDEIAQERGASMPERLI